MRTRTIPRILCLLGFISLDAINVTNAASELSSIVGRVYDSESNQPIPNAVIQIDGRTIKSDAQGAFELHEVQVGKHRLHIVAAGHRTLDESIDIVSGTNTLAAIKLDSEAVQLGDVNVDETSSADRDKFDDKSSADTLTESVSAEALKNPNAQNVGDLMKEVSGVNVSKGANGSSNVSVRGIDQRMLRITIDGQRQGGSGNPLDSIPPEIVQSLEVTKTFTPDMEADAVGGVINVNTGGLIIKDAYQQGRHQITYNTLAPRPGLRNSLTLGQPFSLGSSTHNASILTTVSFDDQYAQRERVSALREWTAQISPGPAPFINQSIPTLTLPLIESTQEHRQRTGFVFNSDARFDSTAVFWRSNLSHDWTHRDRNYNDTDPSSGLVQSLTPTAGTFSGVSLSRRNQEQIAKRDAINLSFGANSKIGRSDLDATFSYGITDEEEPHTFETGFLSNHSYRAGYDLTADPYAPVFNFSDETVMGDTTSMNDPSQYHLNYLFNTHSELKEDDGSLKANLKITLQNGVDYVKVGGKLQQRHRDANTDRDTYNAGSQALNMNGLVGNSLVALDTLDYTFGPTPDAAAVAQQLTTQPTAFQTNTEQTLINSLGGDTSLTETSWAVYGMGKIVMKQWTVLGGVRTEGTSISSTGNQMQLDDNGQFLGFTTQHVTNSYIEVLPGLHLRYEPTPGMLYRGSVTRSMSRPSNADIAPFRTLSFVDHRSRIGAPDLKPYLATNYDVSLDKYSESFGLISIALFYKKIDHFITDAQYPVIIGDLGEFIEFKRVNGESALAMGFEFSWQSPTWKLPAHLGRASVETNYNYNHGEAHHPTRPDETFPLPRQPEHQASLKFHDVNGPVTVDASVSYRTGWWEDLIAYGFDNYINSAWDAEISGSYKIGKSSRITAGVNNLLNRPTSHYAGIPSRMNDWQRNGIEMNLGLQWKI